MTSLEFKRYAPASLILSQIFLNKFTCTPFLFSFQFMIYPQDQRIHDQRNHDRIDQFRHNDPAQIIRELKITFQKEHQKIESGLMVRTRKIWLLLFSRRTGVYNQQCLLISDMRLRRCQLKQCRKTRMWPPTIVS